MIFDEDTYDLIRPRQWQGGVIFASPHSGRVYPEWFLAETRLDSLQLRSSEDAFVDHLIVPAVDLGAVVLTSNVPRAVVDLNRDPSEMDPLVVTGANPPVMSPRILAGLGVIPRVVSQGRVIHHRPIAMAEADSRIDQLWHPYHSALSALLAESVDRFGGAVLVDMHSMPRDALSHLPRPRPDFVLGDRNGVSASPRISAEVTAAVASEGFRIRRNSPFAGAFITAAYGRPRNNVHVVQLEIDRSLYMDERKIQLRHDYSDFSEKFGRILQKLAQIRPDVADGAIAAE